MSVQIKTTRNMTPSPSKVFISYSHDSVEHKEFVSRFAQRLRKDGVDAQIDQYVGGRPPEGWPRWMLDKLDWAEFVLLICTETYYRRFRGHPEIGSLRELPCKDVKPLTFHLVPDQGSAQAAQHGNVISDPSFTIANRLLPYLVDRKEQNDLLREAIDSHRQQHCETPLVCFFHGSPEQCLPEYQKCLEEEYLASLLGLPRENVIHFKVVPWPASGNLGLGSAATQKSSCGQFLDRLARRIYDEIRILGGRDETVEEVLSWAEKISVEIKAYPEPLAIAFYLDTADFFVYPKKFLDWFVSFWATVSVNPYHGCLVFVFVTHRREPPKGLFGFLRNLLPDPCRERLANRPGSLGYGRVLPELDSISGRHITEWTHTYRLRIEKHWKRPAFTLNGALQDHLDKNGSKLSMRQFATVTSSMLRTSDN
jgi:TIR domain/inactive STAND